MGSTTFLSNEAQSTRDSGLVLLSTFIFRARVQRMSHIRPAKLIWQGGTKSWLVLILNIISPCASSGHHFQWCTSLSGTPFSASASFPFLSSQNLCLCIYFSLTFAKPFVSRSLGGPERESLVIILKQTSVCLGSGGGEKGTAWLLNPSRTPGRGICYGSWVPGYMHLQLKESVSEVLPSTHCAVSPCLY